jgi:CheY-like chemotaxis protein
MPMNRVHAALGWQGGIDALRQAAQGSTHYDVIITDLGMPNVG